MDLSVVRQNLPAIDAAASETITLFGPQFTGTPDGHVETDIAGAASLAGLSMLRAKGFGLGSFQPGTMIFTDMDAEMDSIWQFMVQAARDLGLDPSSGWDREVPAGHNPLFSIPDMTRKTEKDFVAICARHQLGTGFFPYVAALAALKIVASAHTRHLLDQETGKALALYYVVAGAKTVPFP